MKSPQRTHPSYTLLWLCAVASIACFAAVSASESGTSELVANIERLEARKCVHDMTLDELQKLRDAFEKVINNGSFAELASDPLCPYGRVSFLAWLRHYLHRAEHLLGVAMPYWDFSSRSIPTSFAVSSYLNAEGKRRSNPLFAGPNPNKDSRTETRREVAKPFPSIQLLELEALAMSSSTFVLFSTRVEAIHDAVSGLIGGDMVFHKSAPFDPLFWTIVANLDRILYRWQLRHRTAEPPRSIMLKDMTGEFSLNAQLEATAGWDRAMKGPSSSSKSGGPNDGDDQEDYPQLKTHVNANIGLKFASAFGGVGGKKLSGWNANRTHFVDATTALDGVDGEAAVAGFGMSFVSAHGVRTPGVPVDEAMNGIEVGAGTKLGDVPDVSEGHPTKSGSGNGAHGDPVPRTKVRINSTDADGGADSGPMANMHMDPLLHEASIQAQAPGVKISATEPMAGGTRVFSGAHNVTHFSNVSVGDPGDPNDPGPTAQASISLSLVDTYGQFGGNVTGRPPRILKHGGESFSGMGGPSSRTATSHVAKGIQQWGGSGLRNRHKLQVSKSTGPEVEESQFSNLKEKGEMKFRPPPVDYSLPSERLNARTPPHKHIILQLCDVPPTKSAFRIEVVLKHKYIIGSIFLLGHGDSLTSANNYKEDRPLDMSRAYHRLLKSMDLTKVPAEVSFRVTNINTGKRVKTPNFTVRYDTFFY